MRYVDFPSFFTIAVEMSTFNWIYTDMTWKKNQDHPFEEENMSPQVIFDKK
jgi:hypothetical protein